ncbi:hypothetical protein V3C99_018042 [Haemonchus contortus]
MAIPKESLNLDHVQATTFPNTLYTNPSSNALNLICHNFEHSYGSFASGTSTPRGFSDLFAMSKEKTLDTYMTAWSADEIYHSIKRFLSNF